MSRQPPTVTPATFEFWSVEEWTRVAAAIRLKLHVLAADHQAASNRHRGDLANESDSYRRLMGDVEQIISAIMEPPDEQSGSVHD